MPLSDYFRAADPERVIQAMRQDVALLAADGGPFDGLSAKGIDPPVALGKLVAFARDIAFGTDTVRSEVLWPPPETEPESWDDLPDDSPWATGPWLERLATDVRDTLAGIDDARVPELGGRWAGIEELWSVTPEGMADLLTEFVSLARRAVAEGDELYCWTCL